MRSVPEDPDRDRRIADEVVVDAYTEEEQALGWHYYLKEHLQFPFRAKCIQVRLTSPLHKGEEATVTRMAPEEDCMSDMLVVIEWCGRTVGVPLAQLEGVGVDAQAARAITDWRYWLARGHQL